VFGAIAVSLTLGAVQFASGSIALPKRRSWSASQWSRNPATSHRSGS